MFGQQISKVVETSRLVEKKLAIVSSRWHSAMTETLIDGATRTLAAAGVPSKNISYISVPGSFEIPLACNELASRKIVDGIVAVGVVIRGETDHYRLIADTVASGLARVGLDTGVPVGFGVITADTVELAAERSGGKSGNKGEEAAHAVLEMLGVLQQIRSNQLEVR